MQRPFADSHLCYNCFQEKPDAAGPCPYCGFDLAENEKKFPVALRAGTVLNDRYIVGRVLGQGGFGITYLALDTQLNAKVAIKEFMPGEIATRVGGTTVSVMMDTKSEEFAYGAERFQEEARTLAKFIGNPNIAGVSSYFDENDTSYDLHRKPRRENLRGGDPQRDDPGPAGPDGGASGGVHPP